MKFVDVTGTKREMLLFFLMSRETEEDEGVGRTLLLSITKLHSFLETVVA